ncbi:RNA polymerase III subunit RPC82-domain-containing protein [Myxozyma melibiosi]|uniref:DNA-directed RNA polymerase III subunit RPC3 n=1 Tax=Myxozyma melibiosi TaxID=54550 RepID=A0ABR1F0U5_9ASCO
MSQFDDALLVLLLRDIYGPLVATVVDTLLKEGRLTLPLLARYSSLPSSAIQRALIPLIQLRFVLYWVPDDRPDSSPYYVAAPDRIYAALVRAGSFVSYVEDRFPDLPAAPTVVKNLLLYGHIRASDYLAAAADADQARDALTALLKCKLLTTLSRAEFSPDEDRYRAVFKQKLALIPRKTTVSETKREQAAEADAQQEWIKVMSVHDFPNDGLVLSDKKTKKSSSSKKRSRDYALSSSSSTADNMVVDESAILTLNHDKFVVLMRSQVLAALARRRIGSVTAAVYEQALECMEPKLFRCRNSTTATPVVTGLEILKHLDPHLDLGSSIAAPRRKRSSSKSSKSSKRTSSSVDSESESESDSGSGSSDSERSRKRRRRSRSRSSSHRKKRRKTAASSSSSSSGSESDDGSGDGDGSEDDKVKSSRFEHLGMHLALLCHNPALPFLKKLSSRGGGEYTIDFEVLMGAIQALEYDQLIARKQGAVACRLLRIIRSKGRIDEKQIAQIALLPVKDIRAHLTALHECGSLDLQEVPKGTDRAPSRTYYLWFHKPASAYALMTQQIVRTMTRCYARVVEERKKRPGIMSKLAREDVKRDEEGMLTAAEKEEVKRLRAAEEKMLAQISRLDRLVVIFRDCI